MSSIKINVKRNARRIRCYHFILFLSILAETSCEKFVEVPPPPGRITENFVFTTDATAISVLTDMYKSFNESPIQGAGIGSISLFAGLAADEYKLNDGITDASYLGYYRNNLAQTNVFLTGAEHWSPLYHFVFRCNAAIEGLTASKSLTPLIKQQLMGEAKFMRAFFYFYLVNMYGEVPLALTTDPEINTLLPRSPKTLVYDQIKKDLKEAKELLNGNFLNATLLSNTIERVRLTKWAAAALLARVYLYTDDWTEAEAQSSLVINNSGLFSMPSTVNAVFLKNSSETIWQIQPVDVGYNTVEAKALVIPPSGPTPGSTENPVQLSSFLKHSFEPGDQRVVYGNWIDTTIYQLDPTTSDTIVFPFKYKIYIPDININAATATRNMTEYFMMLRLGEQYLIRAEARAQLGKIGDSQDDLNVIRNRAGLGNTMATDKTSLLAAILHERQVELFSEWGHRWFDLKRTGTVDAVMTIVTPLKSNGITSWHSFQQLYPLSLTELQRAPNLRQNSGY
jgi:starch-binding outer membrane protein, SusD/RagB family